MGVVATHKTATPKWGLFIRRGHPTRQGYLPLRGLLFFPARLRLRVRLPFPARLLFPARLRRGYAFPGFTWYS